MCCAGYRSKSIDSGPSPSNGFGALSHFGSIGASVLAASSSNAGVVIGLSNPNSSGSSNNGGGSSSKGPKGRSQKSKRGGDSAALPDHHDGAHEPGKIRRTPTSGGPAEHQQQSPPHSISRTPDVANFGGLKFGYESQNSAGGAAGSTAMQLIDAQTAQIKDSPPSSPGSEAGSNKKRIKKQHLAGSSSSTSASTPTESSSSGGGGGSKMFQNGITHAAAHMLGNSLNPNSSMAIKMNETLSQEIEAHIANQVPEQAPHVGPLFPGKIQAVRSCN